MKDLRSRWNALLVFLSFLTMLGCATLQGDPSQSPSNTSLAMTPGKLDFGMVVVGRSRTLSATVLNRSVFGVTVMQATTTGAEFQIVAPALPVTIRPGRAVTFSIRFTPQSVGTPASTLAIASSAQQPSTTMLLAGQGVNAGQLAPSLASIDFGSTSVGQQVTRTESFTNNGSTSVTVSQLSISNADFALSGVTLPLTVDAGQTRGFNVVYSPRAAGSSTATLSVNADVSMTVGSRARVGRRDTQAQSMSIPMSGSATGSTGALTATPASVSFGNVQVNGNASSAVVLRNTGTASVAISQAAVSGTGFSMTGMSAPITISGGQSATFNVTFAPKAAGAASGNVVITSNASNASLNVGLSGMAITPGTLTTGSNLMAFGTVQVGNNQKQTATVTNSGGSSVTINQLSITGAGFTLSGLTTPATVAAGQSASFTVTFAPQAAGNASGTVSLTSTASATPITWTLSGSAVTAGALTPSPSSLSFGTVQTGNTKSMQETLTNSGGTAVTVSQVAAPGAYSVTGLTLPTTLNAGQSASFNVVFSPTAGGAANSTLTVTSNASNASLSVPLTGAGATPGSLTPGTASLNFGSVVVGSNQTLSETITNSGGSTVTISQAAVTGTGFSLSGVTVPFTLTAGASKSLNVVFAPQSAGTPSGTLNITSDASNSSLTVPVSGTALTAGSLAAGTPALSFGTVTVGNNQTIPETLTNSGGSSVNVTQATVTGAGFSLSGLTVPFTLAAGASKSFNVVFTPQSAGTPSGTLTITSNASNTSLTVPLTATAVMPGSLTAGTPSLSFGSVTVGNTKTLSETITNSGGSTVNVSQAAVAGSGFSITGLTVPFTLAAGASKSFSVVFAPQAAGSPTGTLTITSDASNPSLTVPVSGTAATVGTLSPGPASLSFGSVNVGSSKTLSETITNSGGTTVTVSQATVTGTGYSITGLTVPFTLAAGASKSFNVVFAPQAAGTPSGTLTITSDASNASLTVPVSGTAVTAGVIAAGTPSLSFGTVTVGNTKTLSETITNSGGSSVSVSQVAVTGTGFSVSGLSVPFTLAAGASKSFNVVFAPQSAGSPSGSLTVTSDASNPTLTVPVSGTAVTVGTLSPSPASLSFGSVNVGSSKTLSETITNSGGTAVTVSQVTASGTGYSVNGVTVPFTLAAGTNKSFNVVFAPQSAGSPTGSVAITSNGSNPSLAVNLTGTGTAQGVLGVSPTTMSFGSVNVGSNSSKTATLTNTGNATLTVTQASATGTGFSISGLSLPLTLIANQSFTFSVTFTPQSGANATGSVSFTSDASNTPPTISLSGSGVTVGIFAVNPTSFSFGSVTVGSNKNMTATLSAAGGSVTVSSASVNSAEFTLAGPALPLTIASGQTATFTVTFTPQSSGAASANATFVTNAAGSPLVTPLSGTGVAPVQHRVDLTWSPSTSSIVGYNVYRSATSGTGYSRINSSVNVSTSYTDNSVQSGATYFYVTTAVDSNAGESSFSNEVRAAIPTP